MSSTTTGKLENVIIPRIDTSACWDIEISGGKVISRVPSSSTSPPSLLLPPLCHPHIHLDKPYILTSSRTPSESHPDYSDLAPKTGSFQEALSNTSAAKARFTEEDLYLRGLQLLAESYGRGVTAMRVFVEVDHVVKLTTVQAAIRLKRDFAHLIRVQICVFAQDPIFSSPRGSENLKYLLVALDTFSSDIEALGTTPYVEQGSNTAEKEAALDRNIEWAVTTAIENGLHLDFHLDYNIDASASGSVFKVLSTLTKSAWAKKAPTKTVAIGHCTHLTTYTPRVLSELAAGIKKHNLPVHFIGLPTSDLFMMGRPASEPIPDGRPHERPRGTMQVPAMIKNCGFDACIGVNNVGNAFTPYGNGDPLQLACWGTGIYHAGTVTDAELLYECVSDRARNAIGLFPPAAGERLDDSSAGVPRDAGHGVILPGLLIKNSEHTVLPGKYNNTLTVLARQRLSIKDVVWDPPDNVLREVVQ